MKLNIADLEEYVSELNRRGCKSAFNIVYHFKDTGTFAIIIQAQSKDDLIAYSENIGSDKDSTVENLTDKAMKRKTEITELFVDNGIKLVEGWFE